MNSTPIPEQPTEQPEPAGLIPLADLPAVVQHVLGQHGIEALVYWQSPEPEAVQDAPWDADTINPDDLPPCSQCGSYEQWQSLTGNWHCLACEPSHRANLLRRKAARFRRLASPP